SAATSGVTGATNTTDYRNDVHALLTGGLVASAIHTYETNNGGFLYWATQWPHTGWVGGPTPPTSVWMKEINYGSDAASELIVCDFLIYAIDLLERDTRVERYAWWKDRRKYTGAGGYTKPPSHFILDGATNGVLTAVGAMYVSMPVHDPDL